MTEAAAPRARVRGATALVALAAAVFAFASYLRQVHLYENLAIGLRDHGIFTQSLWNVLHGHGLTTTIGARDLAHPHLFTDHLYVAELLFVPLYALWPDPRALFLLQSVALGLTGPAAFRVGKALGLADLPSTSVALALVAHTSFWSGIAGTWGFHMDALLPVLFLFAYEQYLRGRRRAFAALVLLSVLCHERFSFIWAGLALAWLVSGKRREGVALGLAALGYFAVASGLVIPAFTGGSRPWFVPGDSASSGSERLPALAVAASRYVAFLLVSLAAVPLGSPLVLAAVPMLASFCVAWLRGYGLMLDVLSFHALTIVPVLGLATLDALRRLEKRRPRAARGASLAVVLASVVMTARVEGRREPVPELSARKRAALEGCLAAVPAGASVSAGRFVGAHLTHRPEIYRFPIRAAEADVICLASDPLIAFDEGEGDAIAALASDTSLARVHDAEGFTVFVRRR